jgi:hypothetical protein
MVIYNKNVFSLILLTILLIIPMNAVSLRWGGDKIIYNGNITCFDVDYTTDGTMYLAFQKDSIDYPLCIYTSSDHGMTWNKEYDSPFLLRISKMKIIVSEPEHNYLYLFFANPDDNEYPYVGRIASDFSDSFTPLRIDTFSIDATGFDAARSIEDDYSMVFVGASPDEIHPEYEHWLRCYRSLDYGETWDYMSYGFSTPSDFRQQFSICWGPPDNYYLAYISTKDPVAPYDNDSSEARIFYSDNGGNSWNWSLYLTNNSVMDGSPHIAASHDTNNPAIWVASPRIGSGGTYDLYVNYITHPDSMDIYYPSSWPSTAVATSEVPEYWGDIEFQKQPGSPLVNMAWIYDNGGDTRDVHWTWSEGNAPQNWYDDRVINDSLALPWPPGASPRIIYSPGAAEGGSGVVYAGFAYKNLYFDAPWISGIEEKDIEEETFSIYPGIITASSPLLLSIPRDGSFEIRIYDITGRPVYKFGPQLMNAGENSINPEIKGNGIYFLEVLEGNTKVYRGKIITIK